MTIHPNTSAPVPRPAVATNSHSPQHSQLVWLQPNAGFGAGDTYAVLLPERPYRFNPRWTTEQILNPHLRSPATVQIEDITPCMLDCGNEQCREWSDVFTLPGNTRAEAMANLVAAKYSGVAYHVSDCETLLDQPSRFDAPA